VKMDARLKLRECAQQLIRIFAKRDLTQPLMAEAKIRIEPLIEKSLNEQKNLLDQLPRFFFGTHNDELAGSYMGDVELMNALSEFENAMVAVVRMEKD